MVSVSHILLTKTNTEKSRWKTANGSPAVSQFIFTASTATLSTGILKLQHVPQACQTAFENKSGFRSPANSHFNFTTHTAALPMYHLKLKHTLTALP